MSKILSYNTRSSFNNVLAVPKCRSNSGLRTFHGSTTHLWNCPDDNLKTAINENSFKKQLFKKFLRGSVMGDITIFGQNSLNLNFEHCVN